MKMTWNPDNNRGAFLRKKLTKKLFFALPVGTRVFSNIGAGNPPCPIWSAHLTIDSDREQLWQDAVSHGVTQQLANVLCTQEDLALINNRF